MLHFSHKPFPFVNTRYIITRLKLFQSLVLGYFTLVDKYDMDMWMYGVDLLVRNSPLDTVAQKYHLCWSFSLSTLLLVFNRYYDVGVAALVDNPYVYSFITFFYIVLNVNLYLSWNSLVQGHIQIIMDFSSGEFYFTNIILVLGLRPYIII